MTLNATNFFGQNTPAIAAAEAMVHARRGRDVWIPRLVLNNLRIESVHIAAEYHQPVWNGVSIPVSCNPSVVSAAMAPFPLAGIIKA
jgi:hypothetical protein